MLICCESCKLRITNSSLCKGDGENIITLLLSSSFHPGGTSGGTTVANSCQIVSRNLSGTTWTEESADYIPGSQSKSNYLSHPSQMSRPLATSLPLPYVKNKTSINIIKPRFKPLHSKTRAWNTCQV